MEHTKTTNPHIAGLESIGAQSLILAKSYHKWEVNFLLKSVELVREYFDEIAAVKEAIANEDREAALANWADIPHEHQCGIWLAPSKGGIFTTKEVAFLKGANHG